MRRTITAIWVSLAALVAFGLVLVYSASVAQKGGAVPFMKMQTVAAAVGLPAFVVRQTQALARQYTLENIARMPELCVRTEYEIKSGLRPEEGSLEKVMLEIMSLRRPAAGRNQPAAAGRGGGAGKWKE